MLHCKRCGLTVLYSTVLCYSTVQYFAAARVFGDAALVPARTSTFAPTAAGALRCAVQSRSGTGCACRLVLQCDTACRWLRFKYGAASYWTVCNASLVYCTLLYSTVQYGHTEQLGRALPTWTYAGCLAVLHCTYSAVFYTRACVGASARCGLLRQKASSSGEAVRPVFVQYSAQCCTFIVKH